MVNKLEKKYSKELQEMSDEEKIYNDWDKEYEDRYIKLYDALEKFVKVTTVNKKGKKVPLIDSVDGKKVKWVGSDGYLVPLTKEDMMLNLIISILVQKTNFYIILSRKRESFLTLFCYI